MCGFVGIADSEARPELSLVARMRDTMRHRGPDDEGLWSSADGSVAFGFRRLSIIDLSEHGHQPMASADGSVCIVFNGEIYNFTELRAELEREGCAFTSSSDTEVLLNAYRVWGDECVARLNGMFSFAIHDAPRHRIFFARDRAGEKPLFFYRAGKSLMFASELKALLAHPSVPRRIDVPAMNHFFTFGYVPREQAILTGVHKLPQAHAMELNLRSGELRTWPYWTLPAPPSSWSFPSAKELCDEAHVLLKDAVRRQLVADVPVGILLSGGVDSSLVTAVAAEVAPLVKTFTIAFPGHAGYDESAYARMVADHFGTEHHELQAEPTTVDLLPKLAAQFDEPMADSSMVPMYLVSRLVRAHAKVALGGDGGDELFGGYVHYNRLLRHDRLRRALPRPAKHLMTAAMLRAPRWLRGRHRVMEIAADASGVIAKLNLFFDAEQRARLLAPVAPSLDGQLREPEALKVRLSSTSQSALQQATRVDFMTYLCDDILTKVDRASMLASLEVRAPLLDHRMIEFAFGRVPDAFRTAGNDRKILLRALGRRLLPSQLDLTRKQGFSVPFDAWFNGEWGAFVSDVVADADPAIFDRAFVAGLLKRQRDGEKHTPRLFAITMFELWRREYGASIA